MMADGRSTNRFSDRSHTSTGVASAAMAGLTITVETPGLDEMIERLQKHATIGSTDAKRLRAGMSKVTKFSMSSLASVTPVRTGNMMSQIFKHNQTWPEGNVTGTAGFFASRLQYYGKSGRLVPLTLEVGRKANNNGRMVIKPMNFMLKAKNATQGYFNTIMEEVAKQITDDLAGK